jgi:hypothetical protein
MAVKTAQAAVAAWQAGIQSGGAKYTAGINSCTVNPMQLAVAQLPTAAANYQAAISSGRMAAALNNTPVSFWKSQATGAASKWSAGAAKGLTKMTASAQKMQSAWQGSSDAAAASKAAGGDSVARFTAAMNVMKAAGKKATMS